MERITDDQVQRLLTFTAERTRPTRSPAAEDADRAALALQTAVLRLSAAVRFHRSAVPDTAAQTELHATGCWNLLVDLAKVWRDHPDFPADAAVETFDCTDDFPLTVPAPGPDPQAAR